MVTFIKKNQNTLSRIKSKLSTLDKEKSDVCRYIRLCGRPLRISIPVEFDAGKIRVVEEKKKVYVGTDLKYVRIRPFDTLDTAVGILSPATYGYGAIKEIKEKFEEEGVDFSTDYQNVIGQIRNTRYAYEVSTIIDEVVDCGITVELREGEWPRLADREILPLMVIDKETLDADYCNEHYYTVESYRKSREKFNFASRTQLDDALRGIHKCSYPKSLVSIKLNSKLIEG